MKIGKIMVLGVFLGILAATSANAVGVTPFHWGIQSYGTISVPVALNTVMATGGTSQYNIVTDGSDVTFEAKWYRDNGTSLITTESVEVNVAQNVKTKKVIFWAYPTSGVSTPEIYIYGR